VSSGRERVASARILEISPYPPPRAGWGVRVEYLRRHLEAHGHECAVLNIGSTRRIPSPDYETVLGGFDYVRKVWRFSRRGYVAHMHVNGASWKGLVLAIVGQLVNLAAGRRPFLTFHAGIEQIYFPKPKYPLLWPVFWLVFAIPRRVICNNEEVKAKIVEYGVSPLKVVPIPAFSVQYMESGSDPLPADVEVFLGRFPHVIFCYIKMRPLFFPEATVEAFARLARIRDDVGLLLCGIIGNMEPGIWPAVQARIGEPDLADRVLVVEDFTHEQFLQALARSSVCLRTHLSDGVCSSVLEALSLGVPVVAVENHNRPAGVIVYEASDLDGLVGLLDDALSRRQQLSEAIERPLLRDTLAEEAALLTA
jgi:glycosyltransferase involved in cell wall biosynthesis